MVALEQQCIEPVGSAPDVGPAPPALAAAVPAPPREYHIEVVADAAALARLKPQWDALLARTDAAHPFLTHEWISNWWQSFGAGKSLHILVAKDGARLAGIAPLMRCERKLYGVRARCLSALYNPHTPRFDFIVAPDEAAAFYRGIWRHLRGSADWDLLELAQLPADSGALTALSRLARDDRCCVGVWRGEQSPCLPLAGVFETWFSRLSYNHRSKVRRKLNRLLERGVVTLEEITDIESVERALEDGFRIEAAAWKAQTATAINSAPEVAAFYCSLARDAARMGMLRLLFLTLDGVRIAFGYGLEYRNKLYVLKTGYDPEYSYYSPYNLLCYRVFQDGFARGLAEYEFLGNDDAWKLAWTQLTRPHDWLYIFAPALRPRLLYWIKFRCIPVLKRGRSYRRLRDALLARGRGIARRAADAERAQSAHK